MTAQDIAAVALPFVGAFHAYASAMGYYYATPRNAWDKALRVFALLSAVSVALLVARRFH